MRRKRVVILGSTGTIGINTLKVISHLADRFEVYGLTAYNNQDLLKQQINKFHPRYVAVRAQSISDFKSEVKACKVLDVESELSWLVRQKEVDIVVVGISGSAALAPFLSAVRSGKHIAPANKEALVIAGEILMREAKRYGAVIVPVDSEQSAIFQCLDNNRREDLFKVHLTASGGGLLNVPTTQFNRLSVEQIVNHPRWKMGKKISVDSATLMNKGFEIIEAKRLFDLKDDQIDVVIHPESIVHSMVEYQDGSVLAQLSVTDMCLPIQYALTYPQRVASGLKRLDFAQLKQLNFSKPDLKKFPSLGLAMHVSKKGGTLPSVLNASDEIAVEAFLNHEIRFTEIYKFVEHVVLKHKVQNHPSLEAILKADQWAREETRKLIER
jgi:1-deoxy-D-xylulose-5-phosphate reductoisomerase